MSDYADFQTPQAHATKIAATGVPLLSLPGTLITALLQAVAAAGGTLVRQATVTQTGWAANIITSFPAAATLPFVEVTLTWTDPVSGTVYGEDHHIIPGASGASGFTVHATGVAKSSQVTITVTNLDAAQAATVSLLFAQDSVTRGADRWQWRNASDNGLGVPGQTMPALPDDEGVLGLIDAIGVAAGTNTTWLFGMAPGRLVQLSGFGSSSMALNYNLQGRGAPSSVYTASGYLLYQDVAVTGFNGTFIGTRGPVSLKVTNNGAANLNVHAMMTAED